MVRCLHTCIHVLVIAMKCIRINEILEQPPIMDSKLSNKKEEEEKKDKKKSKKSGERSLHEEPEEPAGAEVCKPCGVVGWGGVGWGVVWCGVVWCGVVWCGGAEVCGVVVQRCVWVWCCIQLLCMD